MLRKVLISATVLGALAIAAPAVAGNHGGSTSGGWTSTSGGHTSSSGGYTSTSGNTTTSTSSGTKVPEPGMIGLFGAGLIGLGAMQMRRRKLARK